MLTAYSQAHPITDNTHTRNLDRDKHYPGMAQVSRVCDLMSSTWSAEAPDKHQELLSLPTS